MIDNVAQILKGIMDEESKKLDILSSNMLIASLKSNVNFKSLEVSTSILKEYIFLLKIKNIFTKINYMRRRLYEYI